jgi:hypothetical protein
LRSDGVYIVIVRPGQSPVDPVTGWRKTIGGNLMVEQPVRSRKQVSATMGFMTNSYRAGPSPPRLWLFRLMIIPTLVAKPHHGLLFQDRIPVQSPGGSPIASVLALASDVRTMLGHEMRFEDLVPLLALGNCWRLAAHRTGLWREGALDRSSIEAAMPLFQGFSGH